MSFSLDQLWLLSFEQLETIALQMTKTLMGCHISTTSLGFDKRHVSRLSFVDKTHCCHYTVDTYYRRDHILVELMRPSIQLEEVAYKKVSETVQSLLKPLWVADQVGDILVSGTFDTGLEVQRGGYIIAIHLMQTLRAKDLL